MQASLAVEREVPLGVLIAFTYIATWGRHQLVSQNITPSVQECQQGGTGPAMDRSMKSITSMHLVGGQRKPVCRERSQVFP